MLKLTGLKHEVVSTINHWQELGQSTLAGLSLLAHIVLEKTCHVQDLDMAMGRLHGVGHYMGGSHSLFAAAETDNACRLENLESRVMMSVAPLHGAAVHQVQAHDTFHADVLRSATANPAHTLATAKPLHGTSVHGKPPHSKSAIVLGAPASLSAVSNSPTTVTLNWTDGDALATSFVVLRSADGTHFSPIARITSAAALAYIDPTALSYHNYSYEMEEAAGTSISPPSSPATVHTALNAPVTFAAVATGPAAVQLTWVANEPSATGYNILRSTDGVNFSPVASIGKVTKFIDATVSSGTQYTYQLQATRGGDASALSKSVVATTPLFAPTALGFTFTNGTVNLTWTNNDAKATGYYVLRSTTGATFTQIANLSSQTTSSYTDTNVLSGHTYYYKVQAYPGAVNAALSAALVANTPLAAPSGLTATVGGPNSVTLGWTDNDLNAQGYLIYRCTDGVHFALIARAAGASLTAFTDKSAVSGTTYDYAVRGFAGAIASDPAPFATATTPLAAPATLTATALSPASVKLAWPATDPLATGYTILRSADGVNFSTLTAVSGKTTTTFTDNTVSSATTYAYELQATSGTNLSPVGKNASVTTPLFAPTGASVTLAGGAAQLTWADNDPAATAYVIYRAVDGKGFSPLATLTDGSATAYSDPTILDGHAYAYLVQATAGTITSALSVPAIVGVPLNAPSGLAASTTGANSVSLTWTDNDPDATSYAILRSADGTHFTTVGQIARATANTFIDTAAASGTTYTYAVQAVNGPIASPASAPASATTLLATPLSLTATPSGANTVLLSWIDKEPLATGITILRSTDGVNFTTLTTLSSGKAMTFADTTVSSATPYAYQVQATTATNQSSPSKPVSTVTPLATPTALTATLASGAVNLAWTGNDPNAAGYYVLRSSGKTYSVVTNVSGNASTAWTDFADLTGHAYGYEVQAYTGAITSPMSTAASLSIPLASPTNLATTATSPSTIALSWTDNDPNALAYTILRSIDGTHFSPIATVAGAWVASFADSKLLSATSYTYEVEAVAGTVASPPSASSASTTPLNTPGSVGAALAGAYVGLTWVAKDPAATGYTILRSTDGVNFSQLTQIAGDTTTSYIDTSVAAGQSYSYEVQASSGSVTSAVSAPASITIPTGNITGGVSVTTRHGDELVITAAGASDAISVTESAGTFTITGDGQTFTQTAPAGGTFIYTRGGSDSVNVDGSVTSPLTIDAIDAATTVIQTQDASLNAWVDSTDTVVGTAIVHSVASFAGGVTKALGASLANPSDIGGTSKINASLFGAGPVAADVNQGQVGDCYFLASIAAFASQSPQTLENHAVDLGDGTFAVQFMSGGKATYVRVNNSFSNAYARPGADGAIWALVFEKAFADFRTGANTYASINSGWMDEVYYDLGVSTTDVIPSSFTDSTFYAELSTDLGNGQAVSFGTQNAPNLVKYHAYTLIGVKQVNGVNQYLVRNPWGVAGDGLENSQGIATLSFAQMSANFVQGTIAA